MALPAGWAWKDGNASVGSVGERTFAAVYTPQDAVNYLTVEENLTVKVNKALPQVDAPQGLTAAVGQTLADIKLPQGWAWEDPSLEVGEEGEKTFTAVYVADDTVNYDTLTMQLKVKVKRIVLSTGEIIAISVGSAAVLVAAAYAVLLVLYQKGVVSGAFFGKIYPFVKK